IVPAAPCITLRPTSVEPVNPIFATSGCSTSRCPTTRPGPTTTLTTPSGIPASSASSASRSAESGVSSAGLSTTVLPHASARPRDRVVGLVDAGLLELGQRLLGGGVQDGERAHRPIQTRLRRALPLDHAHDVALRVGEERERDHVRDLGHADDRLAAELLGL